MPVDPAQAAEERRDFFNNPLPQDAVARLGTVRFRHGATNRDASLTFTRDGKYLVSAGGNRVCRWDAATGHAVFELDHTEKRVGTAIELSADGRFAHFLFGYHDCIECDLLTGKERTWTPRFSRDGENGYGPNYLSPDGRFVAALGLQKAIVTIWNVADGSIAHQIPFSGGTLTALAFHPDGRTVVVGDDSHTFRVLDLATGKEQRSFGPLQGNAVARLAISPDGRWLVTVGSDHKRTYPRPARSDDPFLRVWDLEKGIQTRKLDFPEEHGVKSLAFTPDSRSVIAGIGPPDGGAVRCWDLLTGNPRRAWTGHECSGSALTVSPDGKRLATMNESGVIRLWDMGTGKELTPPPVLPSAVDGVRFRPDGKRVRTTCDGTLREWDAATGRLLETPGGQKQGLGFFGPGDQVLRSWVTKPDETGHPVRTSWLRVHDPITESILLEVRGYGSTVSLDRKRVAVADYETVNVFDVASRARIQTWTPTYTEEEEWEAARPLAFTDDGKALVVKLTDRFAVWDVETGKEKSSWDWHRDVLKIKRLPKGAHQSRIDQTAVSMDGTRVVIFGYEVKAVPDGRRGQDEETAVVLILETATGKVVHRLDPQTVWINHLAFSPDGKVLAAGEAGRGTILLWDAVSGRFLARLAGHRGGIRDFAFSPDGKRLASASADSTVLIWDCPR
jgi:WD40 repeat protein